MSKRPQDGNASHRRTGQQPAVRPSNERVDEQGVERNAQPLLQRRAARAGRLLSPQRSTAQAAPAVLPLAVDSDIEEVVQQVRSIDGAQVDLLVPDGMRALASLAACERLRTAAREAGITLTLYVSDPQIARFARRAGLDVVGVDGQVTAPMKVSGRGEPSQRPAGVQQSPQVSRHDQPTVKMNAVEHGGRTAHRQTDAPVTQRLSFDEADWQAARHELEKEVGRQTDQQDEYAADDDQAWQQAGDETAQPASFWSALVSWLPIGTRDPAAAPQQPPPPLMHTTGRAGWADYEQERSPVLAWLSILLFFFALVVAGIAIWYGFTDRIPWRIGSVQPQAPVVVQAPLVETPPFSVTELALPILAEADTNPSAALRVLHVTRPVSIALEGPVTGTTITPVGHGEGQITLINRTPQPVTIPAGTTVESAGQPFEFIEDVTVPGLIERADLTGTDYGIMNARLRARVTGPDGNIPAQTITSAALPPELTGGVQLEVYQWEPFGGGSNVEEPTVAPEDVNRLLPQAVEQLYDKGLLELRDEIEQNPDFVLLDDTVTPMLDEMRKIEEGDYTVFPPVGQIAEDGTFRLEMAQTLEALAEPEAESIVQQAEQAVAEHARQSEDVLVETVRVHNWRWDGESIVVDATVTPSPQVAEVSADLVAQIEAAIVNRPRAQAEQYLHQLVEEGRLEGFRLPPDWQTVPSDVQVDVVRPDEELGT